MQFHSNHLAEFHLFALDFNLLHCLGLIDPLSATASRHVFMYFITVERIISLVQLIWRRLKCNVVGVLTFWPNNVAWQRDLPTPTFLVEYIFWTPLAVRFAVIFLSDIQSSDLQFNRKHFIQRKQVSISKHKCRSIIAWSEIFFLNLIPIRLSSLFLACGSRCFAFLFVSTSHLSSMARSSRKEKAAIL